MKLDLTTFILSVSTAAYMGLGFGPDSEQDGSGSNGCDPRKGINLDLARQNIDLLELLWDKTKGNRTPEEERLLEQLLFETRMKYVDVQKKISKT
jgi:hypothetical protein